MQTKTSRMKTALVLLLCASMLVTMAVPAFAAQKITNPGNFGAVDGFMQDPHNSYAWCSEMFAQTDGDYLWAGTNRDFGRTLLNGVADLRGGAIALIADFLGQNAGLPEMSEDKMGKLYRQRAADSDAPWELMYENPAFNGYRRMIVFNGDLYVCVGMSNVGYDYSAVLRFGPDFKKGDEPEIVLWGNLLPEPDGTILLREYFRAACVYEDKLYVGTFDSKIYVTDGAGLTSLTPNEGAKSTGWELFADLMEHPDFQLFVGGPTTHTTYIWDMAGFGGSLYTAVTYLGGFNMYKLTPQASGGPVIKQVVGPSADAKYPDGMGVPGFISGSPYAVTIGGKEYVYVSTFANGPQMLGHFGRGMVETALNSFFAPASIFRFDADDNWELVVGDTVGNYVPKDKAGNVLPRIGNQRAGFSAWNDSIANTSFNQYVWWMTQYDGKLYASTWDLGVFKRQIPTAVILTLLNAILENSNGVLASLMEDGLDSFSLAMIPKFLIGIPRGIWSMLKTIPMWISVTMFNEKTNPDGFDLFVSEDGVNFEPVTVNGFGNGENYGGRVLLPTQYGLFACTANPFGGAQVWRVDNMRTELQPNIPVVIELKVGETFTASLRGMNVPDGAAIQLDAVDCDYVNVALAHRSSGSIIDTTSKITRIGPQYIERQTNKAYPTQMYDVTFTGKAAGEQASVKLRFIQPAGADAISMELIRYVKVVVTG